MAETTEFELVSPERLLLSEPVEMVVVPGSEGYFGVLPRHAPFIATLAPGVIDVYEAGKVKERIFVSGGFAEVTPERCTVLADEAIKVGEIDTAATEQLIKDLSEDVAEAKSEPERLNASRQLDVARAKLKAAQH
ncbi:MAG: F0F1 ATP synthase subunit epsilon [Proteobacteria bacterium]|nr:F0F1 ATP synthase subunit epsilon [Pseudomonadota bacterium]MBI3499528.1 F0F1 ATP synthase subunit epsilon [Pseudomonadota bacterium]